MSTSKSNIDDYDDMSISQLHMKLLEKIVKENEEIRKDVKQQAKAFEDLSSKINQLASTSPQQGRKKRQRTERVCVPRTCSKEFRRVYNDLMEEKENFQGFIFTESYHSKGNRAVTVKIVDEALSLNGGQEKCSWTRAQLQAAGACYFKSLKDAFKRKQKNRDNNHRQICRRQGRIRDKMQRRISALQNMECSQEDRCRIQSILTKDYTSSDESDASEDESGKVIVLKGYLTRKLPWEKSSLTRVKKSLDDEYLESLPVRSRRGLLPRRVHSVPSSRPIPHNAPTWAVRQFSHSTPYN